ncbi:riboflavin synthase subunit alpha [Lactobacillus delbrueckii subsp. delbrueckii DSM 20074 = JCM 1012]|nr:riboflavin synthase subunit alpha [Lactobacillus delbrueckii subsp. delbrueckii DSM 20074 = JCM 1012]
MVSGKARIQRLEQEGKTIVLTVKTFPENLDGVKIGDSIAVNGCCLTMEAFSKDSFTVTMMLQTFAKTTFKKSAGWRPSEHGTQRASRWPL